MEKDMQNEMEIGLIQGLTRILPLVLIGCWASCLEFNA